MKGINSEKLLNKRVKIKAYSNNEYVGTVIGYVPAQDNEPEVEEISILNEKIIKIIHYLKTKLEI